MAKRKLPLDIALEANTLHMVLHAVQAGLGFGALPFWSGCKLLAEGGVSVAPIKGPNVVWNMIQGCEQPLSMAGERMKAMLRDVGYEQIAASTWQLARVTP